ncbi:MAG: phage minor capsid protein [Actinomycetota bacterium]|nr:phage minor capsid protein [Actinomycetota bacterium]MDH4352286.1 phage minor capsid protein [Gemmatimonadota bacterium]
MTTQDDLAAVRWFHEYGFKGDEDFEAAQEAVEALGFEFVYGGANSNPGWPGWPTEADRLTARLEEAERTARREREIADAMVFERDQEKARIRELEEALREFLDEFDEAEGFPSKYDVLRHRAALGEDTT